MNIEQLLTKLKALIYSKSETDSLLGGKANSSHTHTKSQITDFPSLSTVATSGSYSDLSNKPTIPSNNNQLTNGAGYITSSGSCSYSTTSGTSTYSTYLKSLGSQTPKSGRDIFHSGVYTYTTFTDTNTPAHYGAVMGYGNGQLGSCEMFAEWVRRGKLWFRVLRDCDDSWTDWQQIITSDNIGSQSVNYANSAGSAGSVAWSNVSGRPTAVSQFTNDSEFWSPGGGKWNPNANISLPASGNNQEWSFDMHRNGTTGCYWHVWEDSLGTCLKVSADDGSVSIPRNILYLGGYKVYVG